MASSSSQNTTKTTSSRPKRLLIPEAEASIAGSSICATPIRRSTRIQESPSVDYRERLGKSTPRRNGGEADPTTPVRKVATARNRGSGSSVSLAPGPAHHSSILPDHLPQPHLVTPPQQSHSPPQSSTRGGGLMSALDLQSDDEDGLDDRVNGRLRQSDSCRSDGGSLMESLSDTLSAGLARVRERVDAGRVAVRRWEWRWEWRGPVPRWLVLTILAVVVLLCFLAAGNIKDRVLLLGSAVMAPLLQVGEAFRLGLMSVPELFSARREVVVVSPLDHTNMALDYDVLVEKILENRKFQSLIDKLVTKEGGRVREVVEQKINNQMDKVEEINRQQGEAANNLDKTVAEAKASVEVQVKNIVISVDEKVASIIEENGRKSDEIVKLEGDVKAAKADWDKVTEKLKNLEDSSRSQNELKQIETLREKVSKLSQDLDKMSQTELKKCCTNKEDILSNINNKFNKIVHDRTNDLKTWVSQGFLNSSEISQKLDTLHNELAGQLSEMNNNKGVVEGEVKEATKEIVNSEMTAWRDEMVSWVNDKIQNEKEATAVLTEPVSSDVDVGVIVKNALTKYDADKTGLFDFALETAGGSIVGVKCTETYHIATAVMSVWGVPFWWETPSPRTILQPGVAPGQCWPFSGSHGTVVVRLSSSIHISGVSIEHTPRLLSPDGNISSAPRDVSLSAVHDVVHLADQATGNNTPLLNFTYRADGDPVQTFFLPQPTSNSYDTVELTVRSNHGHPDYTCLYRLRIHGHIEQTETLH